MPNPQTLMRQNFDALLPPGAAYQPVDDGGMDAVHGGVSDSGQAVHDFLAQLADIRNPYRTSILSDLEYEFGLASDPTKAIAQRQAVLAAQMYSRGGKGRPAVLQAQLNAAGFGQCIVYPNDPAVDPRPFLTGVFQIYAAGNRAYAGYYLSGPPLYLAFAGQFSFCTLIVNGDQYQNNPQYVCAGYYPGSAGYVQCETPTTFTRNYCGAYFFQGKNPIPWGAPASPGKWPLVFFVAASATKDGNGYITALTPANIPAASVAEVKRIILKYKPMHSWCVLAFNAV
jgi:hypothetical protein